MLTAYVTINITRVLTEICNIPPCIPPSLYWLEWQLKLTRYTLKVVWHRHWYCQYEAWWVCTSQGWEYHARHALDRLIG